jgi:hypothetical protein
MVGAGRDSLFFRRCCRALVCRAESPFLWVYPADFWLFVWPDPVCSEAAGFSDALAIFLAHALGRLFYGCFPAGNLRFSKGTLWRLCE